MKDLDELLRKDSDDRASLRVSMLEAATTGNLPDRPPQNISGDIPDDAAEMERAGKLLDGAGSQGLDQLVSFLSLLADERRLLRDRRADVKSHKRLWAKIYSDMRTI